MIDFRHDRAKYSRSGQTLSVGSVTLFVPDGRNLSRLLCALPHPSSPVARIRSWFVGGLPACELDSSRDGDRRLSGQASSASPEAWTEDGMRLNSSALVGTHPLSWIASCLLAGVLAGLPSPAEAGQAASARIACTEAALLAAIAQANASGGGTITFDCQATTVSMRSGLGTISNNVVIDGEARNITLQYTGTFTGCDGRRQRRERPGDRPPPRAARRDQASDLQELPRVAANRRPRQHRREQRVPGAQLFGRCSLDDDPRWRSTRLSGTTGSRGIATRPIR